MKITIQKNLGSSRHYHPRIFITTQSIWGVVDITIQEFSLPSKIIFWWFKSVENEQDFEFLAGMLLLWRVDGSSSFYKRSMDLQSLKVRGPFGSLDFQTLLVLGPLQKLLLPLTFCSNVPMFPIYLIQIFDSNNKWLVVNGSSMRISGWSSERLFVWKSRVSRTLPREKDGLQQALSLRNFCGIYSSPSLLLTVEGIRLSPFPLVDSYSTNWWINRRLPVHTYAGKISGKLK
jgi:PAS domain-containing protein